MKYLDKKFSSVKLSYYMDYVRNIWAVLEKKKEMFYLMTHLTNLWLYR